MSGQRPLYERMRDMEVKLAVVLAFLNGARDALRKSSEEDVNGVAYHFIKAASEELESVRSSLPPMALHARSDLSSVELVYILPCICSFFS